MIFIQFFVKERFQEQDKNRVLELIERYPELPLFIYSKLYERIKEVYLLSDSLTFNEMEALELDYDTEFKKRTYSFYDMYIELFNDINKGKYNQEIEEYMKDVLQSYGKTYCNEIFNLDFKKEVIEKREYWTEEEAKEYLDRHINIEQSK